MRLIDADRLQELFNVTSSALLSDVALSKDIEHVVRACLMVSEMISDAPTVKAEPVKPGQWTINRRGNIECSLCGNEPYHDNKRNMNYCPNCGAKMDAEEETEVWNGSNGRKIIAPKGTFDKIYYGEIKDEYEDV